MPFEQSATEVSIIQSEKGIKHYFPTQDGLSMPKLAGTKDVAPLIKNGSSGDDATSGISLLWAREGKVLLKTYAFPGGTTQHKLRARDSHLLERSPACGL